MRMMEHVSQSYFIHMDWKTFPPPFQTEILIMKIWKGLIDIQFLTEAASISVRIRQLEGGFAVILTKGPKKYYIPLKAPGLS